MHLPTFDPFQKLASQFSRVPVYRRMMSDTLTPVTAFHRLDLGQHACLFESVVGGEKVGRYSFLAARPFLELTARGHEVRIANSDFAGTTTAAETFVCQDPLDELRRRLHAVRVAHLPELPPFTSGAIGYAGYDVVRYVEHLPNAPPG